jgi:transcription elongation factor Elf1
MISTIYSDPSDSFSNHWSNLPTVCNCPNCGELLQSEDEIIINDEFALEIHYCEYCENEIQEEITDLKNE